MPKKKNNLDDMVVTICYGQKREHKRKDALRFFLEGMRCSEGCEHERYETIFFQLLDGAEVATDEDDWFGRR